MTKKLFVKIKRELLPRVENRYPYIYLEHGRLEVDDSSVKWIDSEGFCVAIPVAMVCCLFLGPGSSVTHEAIKVTAAANCSIAWVGEDAMLFYAAGITPTSDSRNFRKQIQLSTDPEASVAVARRMFAKRFPNQDLNGKSLKEMMGMEGTRVRSLYYEKSREYGVPWSGRDYIPGKFSDGNITNRILTASNAALYGIVSATIHSMGYSMRAGFIHSGSPLPFVYDIADLYKSELCVDLAFSLSSKLAQYEKRIVADAFRQRVIDLNILQRIGDDIQEVLNIDL